MSRTAVYDTSSYELRDCSRYHYCSRSHYCSAWAWCPLELYAKQLTKTTHKGLINFLFCHLWASEYLAPSWKSLAENGNQGIFMKLVLMLKGRRITLYLVVTFPLFRRRSSLFIIRRRETWFIWWQKCQVCLKCSRKKLKLGLCQIRNENTKAGNKVNQVVIQGALSEDWFQEIIARSESLTKKQQKQLS